MGTPNYVAPETIEGQRRGPRRPVRAGPAPLRALTGQPPLTGDTPFAVLKKHVTEEPKPPPRPARVPPELDALSLRLLRKDPAERRSAEELVVALREWLHRAA